jgi:hypothetical protein
MWIKCLINKSFALAIVGQMVAAVGQPFLTNAPAKVSALWFSEKGVSNIKVIISLESDSHNYSNNGHPSWCSCWLLDSFNLHR